MKSSHYQLAMSSVAEPRGQPIYSRYGKMLGRTTGGSRPCHVEFCSGQRLAVRWSDGELTYPCTSTMYMRPDGARQLS